MNIINSNLTFKTMEYGNTHQMIILHHAEASHCTAADIHRWHLENGWAGIGYHYFVTKEGLIYSGRPIDAIGSHTRGYNTVAIGICAEGSYMTEQMPQIQKKAIIDLCRSLGIKDIRGHKDVNSTDCPGINYPLAEIKAAALTIAAKDNSIIKEIQKQIGVAADGIVGPLTLAACPVLKVGSVGDVVRSLQKILKISADGQFGPNTLKIVKQFQSINGLVNDGIVGRNTWIKLLNI